MDFLTQRENVIVVASHGLGKTMIAKNVVHQEILAGHSARLTAADLILDLTKQETARALQHRLRTHLRPSLLAIDRRVAREPSSPDRQRRMESATARRLWRVQREHQPRIPEM